MKTICSLVVLTSTFFSCAGESSRPEPEISRVQRKSGSIEVTATGIVKPGVGADVRVGSRISGVVKKLWVSLGDVFRKGELHRPISRRQPRQ